MSILDRIFPGRTKKSHKVEYNFPVVPEFKDRLFLIARSGSGCSLVRVDDYGSCGRKDLSDHPTTWHTYKFYGHETNYAGVVRCPESLTESERLRLEKDFPPGHARIRLVEENRRGLAKRPMREGEFD